QDDVAALHVDDARPPGGPVAEQLELLKRAVRLEHGVEMADQQNLPAASGVLGDEVPGASPGTAVDPSRLEAEPLETRHEDVADALHAGQIVRPAVDVDHLLEKRERLPVVRVDVRADGLLDACAGLQKRGRYQPEYDSTHGKALNR